MGAAGRSQASIDAALAGPNGNTISGHRSGALTAFGDVIPQFTLKWNKGVNNYMAEPESQSRGDMASSHR